MKLGEFFQAHLWQILCAAAVGCVGFLIGQVNMTNRMDRMSERLDAVKVEQAQMRKVDACLLFHVTRAETGKSGEIPRCGAE